MVIGGALKMLGIITIFLLIGIASAFSTLQKAKDIYNNGIETEAIVVRNVTRRRFKDSHHKDKLCFVEYTDKDGRVHEAQLARNEHIPVGTELRIMYLPPNYNYVIIVSEEIIQKVQETLKWDKNEQKY